MIIPSNPYRERLSQQVMRVFGIMEILHCLNEVSTKDIVEMINDVLPDPVCSRTVLRDLYSMKAMGFVESTKLEINSPTGRRSFYLWSLATPAKIRDRVGLHHRDIAARQKLSSHGRQ